MPFWVVFYFSDVLWIWTFSVQAGRSTIPTLYEFHKCSLCSFSVVLFPEVDSFPRTHSDQQLDEDLEDRLQISRAFPLDSSILTSTLSYKFGPLWPFWTPTSASSNQGYNWVPWDSCSPHCSPEFYSKHWTEEIHGSSYWFFHLQRSTSCITWYTMSEISISYIWFSV